MRWTVLVLAALMGGCIGTSSLDAARDVLHVPAAGPDAWLEVRIAWDGTQQQASLNVSGPDGRFHDVQRGFDAARVIIPAPAGDYTIRADVPYWAALRSHTAPDLVLAGTMPPRGQDGDRLPNLVTLIPVVEPTVGDCHIEEGLEQGAVRCLRLGNAVGNVGDGPLEVHLAFPQAGLALGGQGTFTQRVYGEHGGRDVAAGHAALHPIHGHWHYAGLARFALHAVDEDGRRGAEVATGHKAGFCFLDWGRMVGPDVRAEEDERAETDCFFPGDSGWSMGISRDWYDYYWSALADQYIDIEGVPDGIYELVSTADGEDSLLETIEDDNSASLLIELAGDQVRVLEERGYWHIPDP